MADLASDGLKFPSAFALRMQAQLGDAWQAFNEAHQSVSPTSIRINPGKSHEKDFEKVPWTDFGYYLSERPSFTFDPQFHGGSYYVQEASSMFLEQALKQTISLNQPIRVLDLCAAPGGKSTHLLSLISDESLLVSNETIQSRATILAENICKWGNINSVVTNNDPEDFESLQGFFDVIVVDAPCSGEGLFRKDLEAVNEWSEENAELCSLRQKRIVNQIWPALKQKGILIYSTCTYNKKENEGTLIALVETGKAESVKLKFEGNWGVEEVGSNGVLGYQFYPHKAKGEGFFISVLRKSENEEEVGIRSKKLFEFANKKTVQQLSSWLKRADRFEFVLQDDLIIAISRSQISEIEFLSKKLRVIQKGTAVATLKHDKLIPEHSLALSIEINQEQFPSAELSLDEAIHFLKKDAIHVVSERGFTLVKYTGTPIGWINQLGNRSNNLYPLNWRIRSQRDL